MASNSNILLGPLLLTILSILLCDLAPSLQLVLAGVDAAKPSSKHVYLAMLKDPPAVHLLDPSHALMDENFLPQGRIYMPGQDLDDYASYLTSTHHSLLEQTFARGTYQKLYSYNHLINGFAVLLTEHQAAILSTHPEVVLVEKDHGVEKKTTHTPSYLGLPDGAWEENGGAINAGEGIVIGLVDTGINPTHPSFSDDTLKPYLNASNYKGTCEEAPEFPKGSCNKKLVGARHFAAAAIAGGTFNASGDYASPLDAEGHGTHTASTAAGNNGVPVVVDGLNFGSASGMAPRAHVAMYKAIYQGIGGYLADVVAAVEQAVKDKVDILSLSLGPTTAPSGVATYFNIFDMAMLSAVKAGVFVVQAAGNAGPSAQTVLSFSPWICSVAAAVHDRTYPNSLLLGNSMTIAGIGLASATPGKGMYKMILAADALEDASNTSSSANECQNPALYKKSLVDGKVLICSYSIQFVFGSSTVKNVADTVKALSAIGVVMVITPELDGQFSIGNVPFSVPAIIISKLNDTEAVLDYYKKSPNFTATAHINGGAKAKYSNEAPKVASYSSRGPDTANRNFQVADVLKPNIMAPGSLIWGGWSPIAKQSPNFQGQNFAMISGTSMATPHIAGIAALVKQKHPNINPAALSSALATTAFTTDKNGKPLLAQNPSANSSELLGPATPFDYGSGSVNATAALDPGIVFDAGFDEYLKFLCTIPGAASAVKNATGIACNEGTIGLPTDLNLPSITIANLTSERSVPRFATSVASASETYTITLFEPKGVSLTVSPKQLTIPAGGKEAFTITLAPTETSNTASFGSILMTGSQGHTAVMTIAVISKVQSSSANRAWRLMQASMY